MHTLTETERYKKLANDWQTLYKTQSDIRQNEISLIEGWAQMLQTSINQYPSALTDTVQTVIRQMTRRVNTFQEVWQNESE